MRISRKLGLIVLIPLAFQLTWLGLVLTVVERAAQENIAEARTDEKIVLQITNLSGFADTGLADFNSLLLGNSRPTRGSSIDFSADAMKMRQAATSAGEELSGLMRKGSMSVSSYNEMRRSLDLNLKINIVLSLALSLFMIVFFFHQLRKRLRQLTENSLLYAANQPLLPALKGDDEVAHLDKVFRRVAQSLDEISKRQSVIADNTANVIFALDNNGRVLSMNRAVQRLWGFTPEEFLGARLNSFVIAGGNFDIGKKLAKIVESDEGSFETRLRKADGSLIDVLWVLRWMEKDESFAGVAHDISARKHAERITLEFSTLMRRGLQGPLDYIRGLFQEIGKSRDFSEKAKVKAASAEAEISRLIKLLDDFLKIDKLANTSAKPVIQMNSAQSLMETAVLSIKDWAARKRVSAKILESKSVVFAEGDQIVRVLINLISNAIKFSPPQSEVLISTNETDDYIEFVVSDKGPGIAPKDQSKVFEKFKQLDQSHEVKVKGTGLGLAICESIVCRHGGEIGVTSDGATGSQFWFRLPKPKDKNSELFGELFGDADGE